MHDRLFDAGAQLNDEGLAAIAASLNFDDAAYALCLNDEASRTAVRRDTEQAKALGLSSTPAFLLGSRTGDGRVRVSKAFYGALPIDQFRTEIERVNSDGASWFKRMFSLVLMAES
jgi:predicted DsbA family dithiol-disulfide isomerase